MYHGISTAQQAAKTFLVLKITFDPFDIDVSRSLMS
jgi:hypothetical protein